jgi:hypothetical protein
MNNEDFPFIDGCFNLPEGIEGKEEVRLASGW